MQFVTDSTLRDGAVTGVGDRFRIDVVLLYVVTTALESHTGGLKILSFDE